MTHRSHAALAVFALLVASGCGGEVSLSVDLVTDLAPVTEVSAVRLSLASEGASEPSAERTVPLCIEGADCDYLSGARLAELGPVSSGTYVLRADALRGDDLVLRREMLVTLDATRVVTVVMTRSCRDVTCGATETCDRGVCQPRACSPETPEQCATPVEDCAGDGDCPGGTTCGAGSCRFGACLLGPGVCGGGFCAPVDDTCEPPDAEACTGPIDDDTIALLTFDDVGVSDLRDAAGVHDGSVGDASKTKWVVGPPSCGAGIRVDDSRAQIEIPDSDAWDLTEGSVDFFVWHDGFSEVRGLVSRDALDQETSGHFTVALLSDGTLWVRLQSTTEASHFCTATTVPEDGWHHVGINFGPPAVEVWVDGVRAEPRADSPEEEGWECDEAPAAIGLANADGDNDNPWLIGGSRGVAPDGVSDPGTTPFYGGAIDHLRISRVRRAF